MSCDLENNKLDENDEHKLIFKKLEIGIFILKVSYIMLKINE